MMKTLSQKRRIAQYVAAACALASACVYADNIDLNAEIIKRLQKSGQLNAIYKSKTGQNIPSGVMGTAVFTGQIGGKGLAISNPGVIATSPMVMQEEDVVNCNDQTTTQTLQIDSEATNSTNFSNSDQFESTQELSATVTYDSPWGVSASATASTKQSHVTLKQTGGGESTTSSWHYTQGIPVSPGKMLTAQFVVTQQRIDNLPYVANFVLAGPVQLVFSPGSAGYSWVQHLGSSLPTQPYPPLKVAGPTNNVYVCRVTTGDTKVLGWTNGGACVWGQNSQMFIGGYTMGGQSNTYEFLVGNSQAVVVGDPLAKNTFDADGHGMQVCVQQTKAGFLPGYVANDGSCVSAAAPFSFVSRSYTVLKDPTVGGQRFDMQLEQVMSEADRTFNLNGKFTGVNAIKGSLRVGSPQPAQDCTLVASSAASVAPGATSMSVGPNLGSGGKGKGRGGVHVNHKKPGAPLPESATVATLPPT